MSITNDDQRHFGRVRADEVDTASLVVGPRGTDLSGTWTTFTPVPAVGAFNAAATLSGRFVIIGRMCILKFVLEQTAAGTAGSGAYTIALPRGIRAVSTGAAGEPVGAARLRVGSAQHLGYVQVDGGGASLSLVVSNDTVAPALWSSSLGALSGTDLSAAFTATFEIAN